MDFVTAQMEQTLTALQTVKPHDYPGAYYAAYSGITWIDPRSLPSGAELIYGRSLALKLWTARMSTMRHEARA